MMLASLPPPRLLIGGDLRGAADRAEFPIENPATGEVIGHAPDTTASDDPALRARSIALPAGRWSG